MQTIDAFLTRKAQAINPKALVLVERPMGNMRSEVWTLRLPEGELGLGDSFKEARAAISVWVESKKDMDKEPSETPSVPK